MAEYAGMRLLDIWYDKITAEDIRARFEAGVAQLQGAAAPSRARSALDAIFAKARRKDRLRATDELTTRVDGEWRIVDDPPVVTHIEIPGGGATLAKTFLDYRASMAENRRELIERYRFVDFALKVVGVGSVGTRCFIVLLEGRDEEDPLILQAKEATASVLEPHVAASTHENHGERVVVGQRLMQATPDIFLGWTRGPGWSRLLLPPAVGHEGLGRHRGAPAAGPGLLRRASAPGRSREPTPGAATRSRSRPTSARPTRSMARSRTGRRPTPTRTSATTPRSRRPSPMAGSSQSPADRRDGRAGPGDQLKMCP